MFALVRWLKTYDTRVKSAPDFSIAVNTLSNAVSYTHLLRPQGTLAEAIRCGGAGIPAFFTRTGYQTIVAEGKAIKAFDGREYIEETSLTADIALVKAYKADEEGNLIYRKTARNSNPDIATAGKITIAEVEEIVPCGTLDPDFIHTPGIYVDRIVKGTFKKPIEHLCFRERK